MALAETVKTMLAVEFGEPERAKANWALIRSASLFVGSVLFMRNLGDLMAV